MSRHGKGNSGSVLQSDAPVAPPKDSDLVALGKATPASSPAPAARRRFSEEQTSGKLPQAFQSALPMVLGSDVVGLATAAMEENGIEGAAKVVVSALNALRMTAAEPDKTMCLGLEVLAKEYPAIFALQSLLAPLSFFIRPEGARLARQTNTLAVLACNLALAGYRSVPSWPVEFASAYVLDALGEKAWVEDEQTEEFCQEILAGIAGPFTRPTVSPSSSSTSSSSSSGVERMQVVEGEEEELDSGSLHGVHQPSRFTPESFETIRAFTFPALKEMFVKRAAAPPRCSVKLIIAALSFPEVRPLTANVLEGWFESASNLRIAKEVIAQLAVVSRNAIPEDFDVLGVLVGTKIKGINSQFLLEGLDTFLHSNPAFPPYALKRFIVKEMFQPPKDSPPHGGGALKDSQHGGSKEKSVFNSKVLLTIWKSMPLPEATFAEVMRGLATEEPMGQLCSVFKRLTRSFDNQISFQEFCRGLCIIPERGRLSSSYVVTVAELLCLAMLSSIPTLDISAPLTRDSVIDSAIAYQFFVSEIQSLATTWCVSVLPSAFEPSDALEQAPALIRRLLFMEPPLSLSGPDSFLFTEQERKAAQNIVGEQTPIGLPLSQATILNVLHLANIGKIPGHVAIDTLMAAATKAAHFHVSTPSGRLQGKKALEVTDIRIVEFVLKHTVYVTPSGDPVAGFSQSELLWRACILLVVIGAVNPETFGAHIWRNVPTARALMEMVLTRQWRFPALLPAGVSEADLERKLDQLDLEDEHNAGTLLGDEAKSQTVVPFYPKQTPRRPPQAIIALLQGVEKQTELGAQLFRCRKPQFFSEVISGQDEAHLMSWLAPIVHSDSGMVAMLPDETVCELVLAATSSSVIQGQALADLRQHFDDMIARLRAELTNPSDAQAHRATEILRFFLAKLASPKLAPRNQAREVIGRLLGGIDSATPHWLSGLSSLRWIHLAETGEAVARAALSETSPEMLVQYFQFLWSIRESFPVTSTAWALSDIISHRPLITESFLSWPGTVSITTDIIVTAMCDPSASSAARGKALVSLSKGGNLFPRAFVDGLLDVLCIMPPQGAELPGIERTLFLPATRPKPADLWSLSTDIPETAVGRQRALQLVHSASLVASTAAASGLSIADLLEVLCTPGISKQTATVVSSTLCEGDRPHQIEKQAWSSIVKIVSLHSQHGIEPASKLMKVMSCE